MTDDTGLVSAVRARFDDLRAGLAAADRQVKARNRRAVALVAAAVVIALLSGPVALVVAVAVATRSASVEADEVSRRVAPEVTQRVIADARSQRAQNARSVLAAANGVLADRGLPTVADPGPQANAEQLLAAASSAQVLSVLPDDVAQALQDQAGGGPIMLPSATVNPPATGGDVPDSTSGGTAPGGISGGGAPGPGGPGGGPAPGNPGGNAGPGPGGGGGQPAPPRTVAPPAPQPPAQEPRRRLIPPLIPLPLPLIGT